MVGVAMKNRWGDLLEDDEELPQATTSGPDGKGIVTRVEYSRNDKGEVMKKTTRTRVVKIEKKVYQVRPLLPGLDAEAAALGPGQRLTWAPPLRLPQSALDRRAGWKKFGDALSERSTDAITAQSTEEIPLERIRPQKQTQEDKNGPDFRSAMASSDKSVIVGSLRDMLYKKRMERQLLAAKGLIAAPEMMPDEVGRRGGRRRGWGSGSRERERAAAYIWCVLSRRAPPSPPSPPRRTAAACRRRAASRGRGCRRRARVPRAAARR